MHQYLHKLLVSVLWGKYPEGELYHMVILCVIFWVTTTLFSMAAAQFYFPTNNAQGLQFLHIPTNQQAL